MVLKKWPRVWEFFSDITLCYLSDEMDCNSCSKRNWKATTKLFYAKGVKVIGVDRDLNALKSLQQNWITRLIFMKLILQAKMWSKIILSKFIINIIKISCGILHD